MALESPPWATQAGSFSAEQTRRAVLAPYARTAANAPGIISGGLLSSADCVLSAAVSGLVANISTGEAIVPGNEGGAQGGYYARITSTTSVTLATANASNPRIDLVCLTVDDTGYTPPSGGTGGAVTAQGVTGTPTSGATLVNLSGAPSLPGSSLLLGYVLVPATATNLVSADILNVATGAAVGCGPWTSPASLGTHVSAGSAAPQFRAENGGTSLRFRGYIVFDSTGVGAGGTILALPAGFSFSPTRYGIICNTAGSTAVTVGAVAGFIDNNSGNATLSSATFALDSLAVAF
jgi:hypothetical protein